MSKFKEIPETHEKGIITIENIPADNFGFLGDLGIQIAKDGRVWICIDGKAFLRFTPNRRSEDLMRKARKGNNATQQNR